MIGASVIGHLYVLKYIQEETSSDNPKNLKIQPGSPHAAECHLGRGGGKPGIPPNPKDQFLHTHTPLEYVSFP